VKKKSTTWLRVIAIFRAVKSVALIAIGAMALRYRGEDLQEEMLRTAHHFGISLGAHILEEAAAKLASIQPHLTAVALALFAYAAIFAVEGYGLFRARRWAEYLTAIVTTSFIPFEIWGTVRHVSVAKVLTIALNAAIVVYLVLRLKSERHEEHALDGDAKQPA
jgi:uncharacterized membrane protein (DUF2068 family)